MEQLSSLLALLFGGFAILIPPKQPPFQLPPPPDFQQLLEQDRIDRILGQRTLKNKYYGADYIPQRDYSKQSCYHAFVPDPKYFTYCDAEKCTFENGQYCVHQTRKCYDPDGRIILNADRTKSVTDYDQYYGLRWKLCLDKESNPLPPPGEKPYAERYKPNCVYKVTDPGYQDYDFLVKCDRYRCVFPDGVIFDMQTKLYHIRMTWGDRVYTTAKNPVNFNLESIDWTCRDIKNIGGLRSEFLCKGFGETEPWIPGQKTEIEPGDCRMCYENKKFVYKDCVYAYDEKGGRLNRRLPAFQQEFQEWFNKLDLLRSEFISTSVLDRGLITPLTDIKMLLLTNPLPDDIQLKVSEAIKRFLKDRETKNFTRSQNTREFKKLKTEINILIRRGK